MNILVVGAGAVGGYFGGRLMEKGENVTFLVREGRRKQLAENGLVLKSVHGDYRSTVKTLVPGEEAEPFDLVLLAVKAYHLEEAMQHIAPYIGAQTAIVPLLNGMAHLERLQARLGTEKVLGGLCFLESTLNRDGEIVQTSPRHDIVIGELDGTRTPRIERIEAAFAGATCTARISLSILKDMWEKFLFITALSGMTTLMNAPVGPILEEEKGEALYRRLVEELVAIAKADGAPIPENAAEKTMAVTKDLGYGMKASMLRDMEKGLPIEADHLQGDFLKRAKRNGIEVPLLELVYGKLKIYERMREKTR